MPASQLGRRERKKLAVRESIRKETLRLIELHGVEGLTIDAICDCVDVAKKTFYNYYATKHDLMAELVQAELLQNIDELVSGAIASGKPFREQLRDIIDVFVRREQFAGGVERELIAYSVGALSANLKQGGVQLAEINAMFLRLFQHNAAELRTGLSAEFCAEMTVGMLNAITLNWVHNEDYNSARRFEELLEYLAESMLAGSE